MSEFLPAALEYLARGWSVFPIGHLPGEEKHPLVQWKPLQSNRPTERQLRQWFRKPGVDGIAVVLGNASGGLHCRDFDKPDAYARWAHEQSHLADMLPTSKTGRKNGHHIYFRCPTERFADLGDGEYRGTRKQIALLPPSRHHVNGRVYRWVVPLPEGPLPEIRDPAQVGLCDPVDFGEDVTEKTEEIASVFSASSVLSAFSVTPQIEGLISATLPTEQGQRNRQIFKLARALKSRPEYADADPEQFMDIVRAWHMAALPVISTKDFDTTWFDFTYCWSLVKFPLGQGPIAEILKRACASTPAVAERYESPKLRLLVSLCRELQRSAGKGPFYLSCRTAGQLLEVEHMTAWRWLGGLQRDRIIVEVQKGGGEKNVRKASRYRYLRD